MKNYSLDVTNMQRSIDALFYCPTFMFLQIIAFCIREQVMSIHFVASYAFELVNNSSSR